MFFYSLYHYSTEKTDPCHILHFFSVAGLKAVANILKGILEIIGSSAPSF
jgi:hypothetical protein